MSIPGQSAGPYLVTCERGHTFEQSLQSRRNQRGCPFCSRKRAWPGESDLFTELPHLRESWDFARNAHLNPASLTKGSDKKAWWRCERGHQFEKSVYEMSKSGCFYCSNKKLLVGFNDLATVRPDLAAEFDASKNGGLTPQDLLFGTSKKVWWRCHVGHSFESKVSQRNFSGSGCAVCKGKRSEPGFSDLKTKYPQIAESWDMELNEGLVPENFSPTSAQKVWWKCPKGHSWLMQIGARVAHGQGCAVCANRQIVLGVNDLQTLYPELAATLATDRNPPNFSQQVGALSTKKAWWECSRGHVYNVSVAQRQKVGCAICANQSVLAGFNDLESQNPDAAAHFLQGRNGVEPSAVMVSSRVQFWWECDIGHQFKAHPDSVRKGNWCPYCGNKRVFKGFNDLETVAPDLAAEWHPTLNGALLPGEVLHGSHSKFWWLCGAGHSFAQTGKKRRAGQGCPGCAKSGFNPLQPGLLYVLVDLNREAIKVGITNAGSSNRLNLFRESGWLMVNGFRFDQGTDAEAAEAAFFKKIRAERQIPIHLGAEEMKRTGGWTETMSLGLASEALVLKLLHEVFEELALFPERLDSGDN